MTMRRINESNFNFVKHISIQILLGCVIGFIFLHPMAMVIHNIITRKPEPLFIFNHLLNINNLPMAGYFVVIGGVFGAVRAFYTYKQAKLFEEIKRLSITDELTSLFNRRYLMNELENEIERARRYSKAFSLLMIDVDNFKQYNDAFGHQEGDHLLKTIAILLKNNIRKVDFAARYGGDEFSIVMPEAENIQAHELIERLCDQINAHVLNKKSMKKGVRITLSIGTATYPSEVQDIPQLFKLADSRLYKMKRERHD